MISKNIDISKLKAPVFEKLGRGLSAFSEIESQLAFLFAQMMHPASEKMSLVAFDAIGLTSPKIRVLKAVAKTKLGDEQFKVLLKILSRVEARADTRNKLAHWVVEFWHPKMPTIMYDEKTEARVIPPWLSGKNLGHSPIESITNKEIDLFIKKCHEVLVEIINFMIKFTQS